LHSFRVSRFGAKFFGLRAFGWAFQGSRWIQSWGPTLDDSKRKSRRTLARWLGDPDGKTELLSNPVYVNF